MNEAQHIIINVNLFFKSFDLHMVQILVTVRFCCPSVLLLLPLPHFPHPSSTPPFLSPSYMWPAECNVCISMARGLFTAARLAWAWKEIIYTTVTMSMGGLLSTTAWLARIWEGVVYYNVVSREEGNYFSTANFSAATPLKKVIPLPKETVIRIFLLRLIVRL